MFRRTKLPARPSIPNKEEILEDLSSASSEDAIYEYNEENSLNGGKLSVKHLEKYEDYDFEEGSPSHLTIDSFLGKINCLKNNLISLEKQKTNLKILEENLIQDMSHIKKELNSTSQPP